MPTDTPIQYRLVTRYSTASGDAADGNQRRDGPVDQKEAKLVGAYITTIA